MYAYCAGDPVNRIDPSGMYQQGSLYGDLHFNVPNFARAFAFALDKIDRLLRSSSVSDGDKCILQSVLDTLNDDSLVFAYASGGVETIEDFNRRAAERLNTDNWAETTPYSLRNSQNASVTFFGFVKFASISDLANLIIHEGGHLIQGEERGHPPRIFDVLDRWLPPPSN
jgi:hypothetical protein